MSPHLSEPFDFPWTGGFSLERALRRSRADLLEWIERAEQRPAEARAELRAALRKRSRVAVFRGDDVSHAHRRNLARLLFAAAELRLRGSVSAVWMPGWLEGERWRIVGGGLRGCQDIALPERSASQVPSGPSPDGAGAGERETVRLRRVVSHSLSPMLEADGGTLPGFGRDGRRWQALAWRAVLGALADGYIVDELEVLCGLLGAPVDHWPAASELARAGLFLVAVPRGLRLLGYAELFEGRGGAAWATLRRAHAGGSREQELALLALARRHELSGAPELAQLAARGACRRPRASAASAVECFGWAALFGEPGDLRAAADVLEREALLGGEAAERGWRLAQRRLARWASAPDARAGGGRMEGGDMESRGAVRALALDGGSLVLEHSSAAWAARALPVADRSVCALLERLRDRPGALGLLSSALLEGREPDSSQVTVQRAGAAVVKG